MIKSMTGFSSVTHEEERATIGVTIRGVNHRYLDLQMRIPSTLAALEGDVRALVARHVARGRVEMAVTLLLREAPTVEVEFNAEVGRAVAAALDVARARGLVAGPLTPGDLLRVPQAITIRERQATGQPVVDAEMAAVVQHVIERALLDLDTMRAREGEHLRVDLDARRREVADLVEQLARAAEEGHAAFVARVTERVRELRSDLQADETIVAQEIVRMASRSDISEELARFRAHVAHWAALVDSPEPCGRKLDFLLQEMNREVNTMGAKADGLHVSELIIAAKAELEKMREQAQNVE